MTASRKKIRTEVTHTVLTEAGYRCAVPTCRAILAIDLHHMVEVSDGGPDDAANLLALCPTCHSLFHRGTISRDSIYAWKSMLVSLSHAFDTQAIDDLLFLSTLKRGDLHISGDGVLRFSRLIAAGLASFGLSLRNGPIFLYEVAATEHGMQLIHAWKAGDRLALKAVLEDRTNPNNTAAT